MVAALPAAVVTAGTSVLEPLLTRAPVVMAVWDTDLRSVWLNEQAEALREVFPYFEIGHVLPRRGAGTDAPIPPAPEALWLEEEAVYVPSSPFTEVLESGRSHLQPVVDTSGTWLENDPDRARNIRAMGLHTR